MARQVQERLLKVVVSFRRDLEVLDILLAMEVNLLGLHLPFLHLDLVSTKHNWNGLWASARQKILGLENKSRIQQLVDVESSAVLSLAPRKRGSDHDASSGRSYT